MLLAVIILWPISLGIAWACGVVWRAKLDKPVVKIIHTVPNDINAVRIVHLDEYMGSVEEVIYKKDSRWQSGFTKVIVKESGL